MKKIIPILIAMTTLFIASSCKTSLEDKAEFAVKRITKKLELNQDQQKELEKIAQNILTEVRSNRDLRDQRHKDGLDLLLSDKITKDNIVAIVDTKREHQDKMLDKFAPELISFHASLSKKQKLKAVSTIKELKEKFRSRME